MADFDNASTSRRSNTQLNRRKLLAAATTLLVLPVVPRLARASTILAVRTWPADEYTRLTLELDSELKAEHFTLDGPDRLVVRSEERREGRECRSRSEVQSETFK